MTSPSLPTPAGVAGPEAARAAIPRRPAEPAAAGRAGPGSLLLAEWTKIRSVRSTLWSLLLLVVLSVGLTALFMLLTVSQWTQLQPAARLQLAADPAGAVLNSGVQLSQLAICVLGVLMMSSEYSTGVIRSSLLAVPRRWPMLAAKGAVFAALVFVVGEVAAFASFFPGAAILSQKAPVSISDPGVLRSVIGLGLYLTVLGLFAMAIGALVRHTAGAITGVIAFVLVLEPLSALLPGSLGAHVHGYLPTVAGRMITHAAQQGNQVLSAWQGFGVFCLWTALLLAAAVYFLRRRDA